MFMPGSHNFLVFNPTNVANTDDDAAYLLKAQRINGLTSGIADTTMHNKLYRQASVMVAALAQFMADQGQVITDGDVNALTTAVTNSFQQKGATFSQLTSPATWSL
jgi:arginine/lysine/ornithine decarboxylase